MTERVASAAATFRMLCGVEPRTALRVAMSTWLLVSVLFAVVGCGHKANRPSGAVIFATVCANCHGSSGNGGVASTPDAAAPRRFKDTAFQRSRTDEDLRKTIRYGKPTGMPAFGTAYDDAQVTELISIIRSFDPERK